ncbi:hypothetical protein Y032_0021g270 [Ancylostoma ceylanicum]|uniref:Uncharacterized protein n=1 Tax=Ancylostoma ceylanicum TaxID=53326 RepID=A0A016V0P5_9BILA|nr:hypothetical protein Y032_0021g270 [Ancylostoma ceylanicum]
MPEKVWPIETIPSHSLSLIQHPTCNLKLAISCEAGFFPWTTTVNTNNYIVVMSSAVQSGKMRRVTE